MKTQKLIPLLDYVLEQCARHTHINDYDDPRHDILKNIENYAKLLSQPLKLSMFVPCDENEVPLAGKPLSPATDAEWDRWENEKEAYNKTKSNVLFETRKLPEQMTDDYAVGALTFSLKDNFMFSKCKINDLTLRDYEITLTENAVKTINA